MADLGTLKNARTLSPQCQFTLYRFTQIDPTANLDVETPCAIFVIPGEFCNLVQETRVWAVSNPLAAWSLTFADSAEQTALESLLVNADLTYASACHWTATDNDTGGGLTFTLSWDLEVTVNGSDASKVDLSLDVTLAITGDYSQSLTVTYEKSSVDPLSARRVQLLPTTSRTMDLPSTDEIVFLSAFAIDIEDPIWS